MTEKSATVHWEGQGTGQEIAAAAKANGPLSKAPAGVAEITCRLR